MSSKRKSPPTKLQDGGTTAEDDAPLPPTIVGGGSDGGGLTDMDESSSNNLSDLGEEEQATDLVTNSNSFYKLTDTSSQSGSGSEAEDVDTTIDDERCPPNKKQRLLCTDPNLLVPGALAAMHEAQLKLTQEALENSRRRNSSECSSPTSDIKTNLHNNNNSMLFNNNSSHPAKRTMDDVLKRLTSKMNNSTIREENKRPTPATTPNTKNQ